VLQPGQFRKLGWLSPEMIESVVFSICEGPCPVIVKQEICVWRGQLVALVEVWVASAVLVTVVPVKMLTVWASVTVVILPRTSTVLRTVTVADPE